MPPPSSEDEDEEENLAGRQRAAVAGPPGVGATLHLPTSHLGLVTAHLHLRADGRLTCRLTASDARGAERIERTVGGLTDALARAGFDEAAARVSPATGDAAGPAGAPAEATAPAPPRVRATQPLRALDLRA